MKFGKCLASLALVTMFALVANGCGSQEGGQPVAAIGGPNPAAGQSDGQTGEPTPTTLTAGPNMASGSVRMTPATVAAPLPPLELQPVAEIGTHERPEVSITTSLGEIRIVLFPDRASATVQNFLFNYVDTGFYDQTVIHHSSPGQMFTGGGFDTSLTPKLAYGPIQNEANNGLQNRRGTIAMLHDPASMHSATSQFFINTADNPSFDYRATDESETGYCVFGEIVAGLDVADRISKTPANPDSDPKSLVVIQSVRRVK